MRIILESSFLAAAALLLAGCGGSHEPKKAEAANMPPVPVRTTEASTVEWPALYEAAGTVRARTSATISSKVMGYIREMRVAPGQGVAAGQLLVTLEARDLESQVRQAQAAEQEARSAISEAENGVAAAKAQMALAQTTFRRMEDLFSKKSVSNQEFDEAQARLRTAEANYQMALSKRTQLDSKIAQARQGVESASVMRSYAELRAPFAGVVTEKHADAGQLATPGAPLLVIERSGAFRLEAPVEESMLGSVRVGQKATAVIDASGQTLSARVDEIVPSVDAASRAFLVKASLPASPALRSGAFGRLRIERGSHSATVVPAAAVVHRGELQSVYVVENGIARTRMITTGDRRGDRVEVLSGLQAGERVVHPIPANLTDGAKVEVRQ